MTVRDLQQILSLIDLTSLNETDTAADINVLCQKAITPFGQVAAVCVYPQFVKQSAQCLEDSSVNIATVVNFPQGRDSLEFVLLQTEKAILDGANEIDVVFPYEAYLAGEKKQAVEFVRACKQACGDRALLKVILETGALQDVAMIAEMSSAVLAAGADFLKTSTGKIAVGATHAAARAMLLAIKQSNHAAGIKISGGVRTVQQAQEYIALATDVMGPTWISPATMRLGASQLLDVVLQSFSLAQTR